MSESMAPISDLQFCFGSLCFVNFSMVMENEVLPRFLAGVFPTGDRDLSIFSPLRTTPPRSASRVLFRLRPDVAVTAVNSAIEELSPLRVIECTDVNLSFPDSVADSFGL
jgi:hypothetical protein